MDIYSHGLGADPQCHSSAVYDAVLLEYLVCSLLGSHIVQTSAKCALQAPQLLAQMLKVTVLQLHPPCWQLYFNLAMPKPNKPGLLEPVIASLCCTATVHVQQVVNAGAVRYDLVRAAAVQKQAELGSSAEACEHVVHERRTRAQPQHLPARAIQAASLRYSRAGVQACGPSQSRLLALCMTWPPHC